MGFMGSFQLFYVMFFIVFALILSVIVVSMVRGLRQWSRNNKAPRLTVPATVVAKRTNVTHHHGGADRMQYHTSTTYYATFQVESGDRMELPMAGSEYGMLVEGDRGKLTFQGTRYLGFERQ